MKCQTCGVDVGLTAAELGQPEALPTFATPAAEKEFFDLVDEEMREIYDRFRREWAERYFGPTGKPRRV